jgi:hypothetical protein
MSQCHRYNESPITRFLTIASHFIELCKFLCCHASSFGNNPQRVSVSSWVRTFRNFQNLVITEGARTRESCSLRGCNKGSEPIAFGLLYLGF